MFLTVDTEMSSDNQSIVDLTSDSEDDLSFSTVVVAPDAPMLSTPLTTSDAETEPLEEGEIMPTPSASPATPPVSSSQAATVFFGPNPLRG